MKRLLLAAALLLPAAPAYAYPQWMVVSDDRTVVIDINSIKDHGQGVRSVVMSNLSTKSITHVAIACKEWQYASFGVGPRLISPSTAIEVAALAVCPGDRRDAVRSVMKTLVPTSDPLEDIPHAVPPVLSPPIPSPIY
ncbi:hypothetical protein [Synechococcus sp. 1G10]|uniref:hypothetical protein n=1 Tax=Synechococcus sp. 1G10 TaxID=2025605 RepID=UPI000B993264|nr:hypothetical protein [Synechococcus sp. 1G10]